MAEESNKTLMLAVDCPFVKLPDHLLLEIFVRFPIVEWRQLSCVNKYWANLFREDCLWHAALIRRFVALYMSKCIFPLDDELSEIVGHTYLYLKEQLDISNMPPPSGILHGTFIDQFIACGKSRDKSHELASLIWLAVMDNLEDNHQTFLLLKRLALEGEVFLPYPYSRDRTKLSGRYLKDFLRIFVTACIMRITTIYWLVPNKSLSQYQQLG